MLRGVATVEDVDKAVSSGPGLRWAAMGPHLLYDLGGGEDGIVGHVQHLAAVKEGMLRDLATWTTFPPETGDGPGRRPHAGEGRAQPTTSWSRNATPCSSPTCAPAATSCARGPRLMVVATHP